MMPGARRAWLSALLVASLVGGALLEYVPPPLGGAVADGLMHEAAARLFYAAAAAALCGLAACLPGKRCPPARLAWWVLALAMAVALNNFPIATLFFHRTASVTAGAEEVLALALVCLATALFEELLFRGFLLPLCLARWGGSRRGGFAAVLLSSAVFGACHLFNLFGGAGPGATLLQVGYSFLIGCLAAALCCLFGRLLPAILFHAVYNLGGYLVPRLGSGPLYDAPTVFVTVLLSLCCAAVTFSALWLKFSPVLPQKVGKNHKT